MSFEDRTRLLLCPLQAGGIKFAGFSDHQIYLVGRSTSITLARVPGERQAMIKNRQDHR